MSYVDAVTALMQSEPGWKFALLSTVAADLGNTVLFPSLCCGGELHVISEKCARDPRLVREYFRRHEIDCTKITPSHLASLQSMDSGADLLPRRLLVLGGEASQWSWIDELRRLRPDCRVINHYGPTECTVGARCVPRGQGAEGRFANVPLGRPLRNGSVYVLDEYMMPQPAGIPGELYIGGAGVARGYIGREALTAERFLPDPFSATPGARMYRTGDRARWNSAGYLEFLGRVDDQVKIRGFRVELGEIEAALNQHPDVRQSAVVLRGEGLTQKLIAYVSLRRSAGKVSDAAAAEAGIPAELFNEYLRQRLPEYMIPATVAVMPSLPLTPNGKIDRRALPATVETIARPAGASRASNGDRASAGDIWKEVLGVEQVGIHDNFLSSVDIPCSPPGSSRGSKRPCTWKFSSSPFSTRRRSLSSPSRWRKSAPGTPQNRSLRRSSGSIGKRTA